MNQVKVAAVQMAAEPTLEANLAKAEARVREAARQGANVILLQELFANYYFCKDQNPDFFELAYPANTHPVIERLQPLAAELAVVLPVSFFERAGQTHFNSLLVIDADGALGAIYRKSHIPDGPGYQEKFYFTPGDTGFRVWQTRYGCLGAAICWDQWFPEAARCMVLQGAEILCYPTAIGSEPQVPELDSRAHWQRVMQGHSAANMVPVIAANRVGREQGDSCAITFYGASFITDETGALLAEAGRDEETILYVTLDLDRIRKARRAWGLFRDRRPELYTRLTQHV